MYGKCRSQIIAEWREGEGERDRCKEMERYRERKKERDLKRGRDVEREREIERGRLSGRQIDNPKLEERYSGKG